jgi:multiple sugar transport system ATP-binding protein
VVLSAGRIEQVGAPMELYNSPANVFVAGFIGSPKMNFIDATRLGEDRAKTIGVRPEHLSVSASEGTWKGTVVHAEHLGADTNLYLDCEKAGLITVRIFGVYNAEPGATLYATPDPGRTYRFDAQGHTMR